MTWTKLLLAIVVSFGLVGLCCAGVMALDEYQPPSPLRLALPPTATEIEEWRWAEDGLLSQDYRYGLTAKITEEEFLEYVQKLELTPHTPEREYSLGFILPSTTTTLYVYDSGSWWTYATWENGYMYVVSYNI